MNIVSLLTDFTKGELSPKYHGRVDKSFYFQGARTLSDFLIMPQGGVTRIPGSYYKATLTSGTLNDDVVRLIPFTPTYGSNYLLVFTHLHIYIYKDGVLKFDTATPYNGSELKYIQYAQVDTSLVLVDGKHEPKELDWTSDTVWTLNATWSPYFSTTHPYPQAVAFHEQRLVFGGTTDLPNTIFGSQAGDVTNFTIGTNPSDPWEYNVGSGGIHWIMAAERLVVGTGNAEYIVASRSGGAITPIISDMLIHKQPDFGSEPQQPLLVNGYILFVQQGKRILRNFAYNSTQATYQSADLTFLSDHLTVNGINEYAYQRVPNSLIWVVSNGKLAVLNFSPEYQLVGWSEASEETVESVAVVKGDEEDEVWITVKRTINGSQVRHLEKLAPFYIASRSDYHYVRDGISATPSGTTVSGLDHLEGETVDVCVDGLTQTQKVVSGGAITLDSTGTVAHVGLPYDPDFVSLRVSGGQLANRVVGRIKRVIRVRVLFYETPGATVYSSDGETQEVTFTLDDIPSGAIEGLFSGWKEILFPNIWDRDGYVEIKSLNPQPITILAMAAEVEVY